MLSNSKGFRRVVRLFYEQLNFSNMIDCRLLFWHEAELDEEVYLKAG